MFVFPAPVLTRRPIAARLLDEIFTERAASPVAAPTRTPALDVAETDSGFTLVFDVPGVTREQLKASVHGRRVVLETTDAAESPAAPEGQRVLYRERTEARYARTVVLPAEVDATSASARFDNGVLTLTLAKQQPAGATQIAIG